MKIVVCINHVPDTETKIKIAPDNVTIDKTGVNYMLSPYDEFAVEEALRMRDKFKGDVIAVSVGTDAHKDTLRAASPTPARPAWLAARPRPGCALCGVPRSGGPAGE